MLGFLLLAGHALISILLPSGQPLWIHSEHFSLPGSFLFVFSCSQLDMAWDESVELKVVSENEWIIFFVVEFLSITWWEITSTYSWNYYLFRIYRWMDSLHCYLQRLTSDHFHYHSKRNDLYRLHQNVAIGYLKWNKNKLGTSLRFIWEKIIIQLDYSFHWF